MENARTIYENNFGVTAHQKIEISTATPRDHAGLQAVDCFLWALQRLYETGDARFWEFVRSKMKLVYDMDDTRVNSFGRFYNLSRPLTAESRTEKG